MFQILVLVGLLVCVVRMWLRMNNLEARLALFEDGPMLRSQFFPRQELVASASDPALPPDPAFETPFVAPPPLTVFDDSEPEPEPEPEPDPDPIAEEHSVLSLGFEDLFGRRLPIWAGGITLAVAGVLIVRLSIEAGLFPPLVRVLGGLVFGMLLVGGAEVAHRRTDQVRDPRVAQALSGAGLATLYASTLIAANLYHLISPFAAFLILAAVTAAAMGLALRFGSPSALLGLVGGLAAPALTGGGPANVPLLALYLTLVIGGLFAVSRRQRWGWLAIGALIGGLGWGGLLIAAGAMDAIATASTGIYLLLIGCAFPMLGATDDQARQLRSTGSLFAALEVAALVASGGFAPLNWGLFGLISIAMIWLARADRQLPALPALGLAIAIALIAAWPHPPVTSFTAVLAGTVLIYGAPAIFRLWKADGSIVEAGSIAALGLAGLLLPLLHYHGPEWVQEPSFGILALLCALLPTGAALLGWTFERRRDDARFATLVTTSAVLIAAADILALPLWMIPAAVGAVGLATLFVGEATDDPRLDGSAWTMAGIAGLLLALDHAVLGELARAGGLTVVDTFSVAAARWAGLAVILAGFAWRGSRPGVVEAAQGTALFAGYVAIAQLVPTTCLPLVPAIAIMAFALWDRFIGSERLRPAIMTASGLAIAWGLLPFAHWAFAVLASLAGRPVLLGDLPNLSDALLRLAVPGLAILATRALGQARLHTPQVLALGLLPAAAALHILYKHLFALRTQTDFVQYGLAERTLWEIAMAAAAAFAWHIRDRHEGARTIAIGFATAALAHAGFYSLLLHNPLWSAQLVGTWPVLNWLLPAYALPLAVLWAAGRAFPGAGDQMDRVRVSMQMLLILLFGASELRQFLHGPLLTDGGVSANEDLLRSLAAITVAIGFLLWGLRDTSPAARSWRIGSLVLMLAAVCKVFLIDAAGLEGLLRIASFVALGFSLIGIGWLYSRYLKAEPL